MKVPADEFERNPVPALVTRSHGRCRDGLASSDRSSVQAFPG